jgi:hypothetical protein
MARAESHARRDATSRAIITVCLAVIVVWMVAWWLVTT